MVQELMDRKAKKLGLGTVQWGLNYGISNHRGMTSSDEVASILVAARSNSVSVLDTASLYGSAEVTLGANRLDSFNVVTKTPRFSTSLIEEDQAKELISTFECSLKNLGLENIYGLLAHHADDLLVEGGERLIKAMQQLKEKGKVDRIGVSIYDGSQIERVLKLFKPDLVQLPLNVFDQRLIRGGHLQRLKDSGVEIHVRSVFLQGLLLMPLDSLPIYFEPIRHLLCRWHERVQERGMSNAQAALSFVRDIPEVDVVLVGIESTDQLMECIQDFSVDMVFDATGLACDDPKFINPALWRHEK